MDITQEYGELFSSLMALIRSSNSLYSMDVDFVRSLNRNLGARSEAASQQLLAVINDLAAKCNGRSGAANQQFQDPEDVLKRWKSIEQTFDLLSDKIDIPQRPQTRDTTPVAEAGNAVEKKEYMRLANNIPKPQLNFATKVDNSLRPFKPLLTQKPFATNLSLSQSLVPQAPDAIHASEWYEQPYKEEIAESTYPPYADPTHNEMPQWDSTPFTFVDSPKKLFKMVNKLEKATEIAVDVEHHDYRSYLGLVCLLQISGLGEDYVIDALTLRSELQVLNKVFANPSIIKVFHGAKMDIMWLQRDLGVYVVGLFDTYFAARELQFPKLSLAYMLQQFAGFQAQKKYQLADWRLRPLPQELIDYARADTHFLLYIYHQLRQKLTDEGKLQTVFEESRKVASYRYEHPGWNELEPTWVQFAYKYRLNGQLQRAILVKLFEWRDQMARKYDESTRYIMAPQFVANLCVTKPSSAQGVLAASHNVSPVVRKNAEKLAELIQDVCADPNSVDTTIPDPIDPSQDAAAALDLATSHMSIADLKRDESSFMGPSQSKESHTERSRGIPLSVVTPEEMKEAHRFHEEYLKTGPTDGGELDEEMDDGQRVSQENNDGIEKKEREDTEDSVADNQRKPSSGKKLNIVGSADAFDLTTDVNKSRSSSKDVKDEPAFDFSSAPSVIKSNVQTSGRSFSQFSKNAKGPKGVSKNTSKFKNAKSFRR